MAYWLSLLYL